ncbi:hypothetical protein M413DRAFT_84786 [Hebeloma cylindrosporum]|uniref:Uncharacterized protein n=1 Tax=Hebeloma cylindrosporum TaxID=76867 RepID=A0A0C2Z6C6_HEBCY|nr:hypothetical protein M413DRAFT_84786 [Hebeloma cylindrosporum h7]
MSCWFFFPFPHFLPLKSLHPPIIVTIRLCIQFFFFFSSHLCSFSLSLDPLPPMLPIVISLQSALIPLPQNPSLEPAILTTHHEHFKFLLLPEINSKEGCLFYLSFLASYKTFLQTFGPIFFLPSSKTNKKSKRLKEIRKTL